MKAILNNSTTLKITSLVILLFLSQSCYHYRINTGNFDPGTGYEKEVLVSWFWGLGQSNIIANNCDSIQVKSLDEVRITSNLGYSLIAVATLGIISPMTIEWKCAKPCSRIGEIP